MKIALQAAVGVSPSEPSQAVEEMKRRSREGHGQEARAERGEPVVSAAALRHGRPLALLLLAQDTAGVVMAALGQCPLHPGPFGSPRTQAGPPPPGSAGTLLLVLQTKCLNFHNRHFPHQSSPTLSSSLVGSDDFKNPLFWEDQYMEQKPLGGPLGKMNLTDHMFQDSSENITTSTSGPTLPSSLDTAATAVSGSIGVVALILLLVGLLSVTLKKWRHERLFKKQQKHQTNFLHKSLELSCHADAIYSNVINLAPRKEDDFAVYANVPPFNRPRRTSPDHVEYASIVFH